MAPEQGLLEDTAIGVAEAEKHREQRPGGKIDYAFVLQMRRSGA